MPSDVQKHIYATYFDLRMGMVVLGFFFPFVLLLVGRFAFDIPYQPSMSAYYFAFNQETSELRQFPMRDWFVGITWAIGCLLIIYRGFSRTEDRLLTVAGLCALGAAMLPTAPDENLHCNNCGDGWKMTHQILSCAALICVGYTAVFCSEETLKEVGAKGDKLKRDRYRMGYALLTCAMVLVPLVAIATYLLGRLGWRLTQPLPRLIADASNAYVLLVEIVALGAFAVYWLVKTIELYKSGYEHAARNGQLRAAEDALTEEERNSVRMTLSRVLEWEPITQKIARFMGWGEHARV